MGDGVGHGSHPIARTLAARVTLACVFCHDALGRPAAAFCASCLAPHHADCFRDHGQCAAPGCSERGALRPRRPGPRWRARVLVAALVGLLGAQHVAWRAEASERERRVAEQARTIDALGARLAANRETHLKLRTIWERERQVARLEREVEGTFHALERCVEEREVFAFVEGRERLGALLNETKGVVSAETHARWRERTIRCDRRRAWSVSHSWRGE